jgi:thioredoxin reductase (NADPH)
MYDLLIIGAGPAGLTASIYASCFHLSHLVIGKVPGGQMIWAPDILNYSGFTEITGKELTGRMVDQVKTRGGEIVTQSVTKITHYPLPVVDNDGNSQNGFEVETEDGKKYQAKALIIATGTERRKLNIPGEMEYTGKGVAYCATCERQDYEGKLVAVVGGGNSAVQAAVQLAQAAKKVSIFYRGTELRGDGVWLEQIKKKDNIEVLYQTVLAEITGDGEKVTGIKTKTVTDNKESSEPMDKVFIEIGGVPGTALAAPIGVKVDAGGYIVIGNKLETSVPGVFAAGDLVSAGFSCEQISSAVGLGARASSSAFAYLKGNKAPSVWGASQIKR